MSDKAAKRRISVRDILSRKGAEPQVWLTAYSAQMARLFDPHVDVLLVGDSLGMVLYGLKDTLGVDLKTMIRHGAAVVRGSSRACVIVDLPFASYQESPQLAYRNAARLMAKTGCAGVKLEGGKEMAETIRFLVQRGIPVCAHIGLLPQSVHATGYGARGQSKAEAQVIMADARAVAEAGAFAAVIEGTVEPLARRITKAIPIPTIGIGASPACDGQVLVGDDVLGLFTGFTARFVKRYANLGKTAEEAAKAFAADVRARRFPEPRHCYDMPEPKAPKAGARGKAAR
jgi:3-methyl-2-oxobutanoate hydroxymethyltransferase